MPNPISDKDFEVRMDAEKLQTVMHIVQDKKRLEAAMKYLEDQQKEIAGVLGKKGILKALK